MREEFEAVILRDFPRSRILRINRPGSPVDQEYENTYVQAGWHFWQASRAELVIELPDHRSSTYCQVSGFDELAYTADLRASFEAAGLKVRP